MNTLSGVDHLLAAGLAFLSVSLLFRKAPPAGPASRRSFYVSAAAGALLLAGVSLSLWHFEGRPLAEFGLLHWYGDPLATSVAAAIWVVILLMGILLIRRGFLQAQLQGVYSKYDQLMPVTRGDKIGSWLTSVSAGFGEEIVYRGFLLWYGSLLVGTPLALFITSVLFGIAHGYQSRFGVIFATIAGLALGLAYLVSGSLFLAMWMHATYNMASFATGAWVLRKASR